MHKKIKDHFLQFLVVFCLTMPIATSAFGEGAIPKSKPLQCDVGPISKTYGMTQWLVYSCHDTSTVIIFSAPGNPASPFYFIFYIKDGQYKLGGEGTGNKAATDAAFKELHSLSVKDIRALIEQTLKSKGPG